MPGRIVGTLVVDFVVSVIQWIDDSRAKNVGPFRGHYTFTVGAVYNTDLVHVYR